MFGKAFSSMYSGSMVGSGAVAFAVWGYVIANARPDRKLGGYVELNPTLLSAIIGEPVARIEEAIHNFCRPDARSRTKTRDGRRLIRQGEFAYQVVNFQKYRDIRNEEARREQNRVAQERFRAKKLGPGLPGEATAVAAMERGDDATADHLAATRRERRKP